jgi:uracil-DNA glycosylase
MVRPVVTGKPVMSPIMLIGQAPGVREGPAGKPFAWTAGKTMFGWFSFLGLSEDAFRDRIYMSAVCRCFPGKADGGGDRVPSDEEVEPGDVGVQRRASIPGAKHEFDMIALPHPSGASTWHRTEPGKTLLVRALSLIAQHEAWQSILEPKEQELRGVSA